MIKDKRKIVSTNRKARHSYFIEQTLEAGIVLTGTEVKSIRQGKCNIKDSYAMIEDGEAYVYNMHVSPYEKGNIYNKDPLRKRKLLLHKKQINKLTGYLAQKGYTLVILSVYFNNGLVKVQLAVGKGKKLYDKRQTIAKKEAERKIQRQYKEIY